MRVPPYACVDGPIVPTGSFNVPTAPASMYHCTILSWMKAAAFIQDRMVQWYMEAGAVGTLKLPVGTMGPSTHAYGGTRMGNNPDTNVVDRWGFSHEAANLGAL